MTFFPNRLKTERIDIPMLWPSKKNQSLVHRHMPLPYFLSVLMVLTGCATSATNTTMHLRGSMNTQTITRSIEYDRAVRALLSLKPAHPSFEVEVWTDKTAYVIGDEITFFFKTNQDAYVTLVDVGSSGTLKVIFPNRLQRNNLVKSGAIHAVPSKDIGFKVLVNGPVGSERIKAIATRAPWHIGGTDAPGFATVSRGDPEGSQAIKKALKKIEAQSWAEGRTEILIFENEKAPPVIERERQIKPEPPEKPIDITGTPGIRSSGQKRDTRQ